MVDDLSSTVTYNYDLANRLTSANGVAYTYDANGNLLSDGANTYTYDSANRLTSANGTGSYTYNGLGDRLSQNGVNYTLDLNTGLTQVLSEGTTTYTYGLGRISQQLGSTPEYFLGDALGSVRQLTSQSGAVTYAASYDPYGVVTQSGGASNTEYGFTGESQGTSGDSTQLIYLRARFYNPAEGRFITKDPSRAERNLYIYTKGNPVNRIDPSGLFSKEVIEKNMNFMDFASPGGSWKSHSHWGFYALLLYAENYDTFEVGGVDLRRQYPEVIWRPREMILEPTCGTIMIGSKTLRQYYDEEIRRQSDPDIWWRDTTPMYYNLFRGLDYQYQLKLFKAFTDGADDNMTTYPVFHSLSGAVGIAEFNIIADADGNKYLAISGGPDVTVGVGYAESYLCTYGQTCSMPSPTEIQDAIAGICGGDEGIAVWGVNLSPICWNPFTYWEFSKASTYYVGLEGGGGLQVTLTLPLGQFGLAPNPSLGWRWAIDNQRNGINAFDILAAIGQ